VSESEGRACHRGGADLVILGMAPYNDSVIFPGFRGGPALIPAAHQAVDDINRRCDILPGFTLKLLEGESGCNFVDKSMVNFTHLMFHHSLSSRIVGMVGPACTASTIGLGNLIGHTKLNIMQVSIATSPNINGLVLRNTFRTVGSSLVYVSAQSKLIKQANWTIVGAIYDSLRPFLTNTHEHFVNQVDAEVFNFPHMGFELQALINDVKESCVRVIFVFLGQEDARKFLCLAIKNNLVYPSVQFLFIDRTEEDFTEKDVYLNDADSRVCSTSDMKRYLSGVILIRDVSSREDVNSTLTEAGISFNQFNTTYRSYFDRYVKELGINPAGIPQTGFHHATSYYDAVWALALALNKTAIQHDLSKTEPRFFADGMRENLKSLQFEGMSGRIKFDELRRDVPTAQTILSQCLSNSSNQSVCKTGYFINNTLVFKGTTIPDNYIIHFHKLPLPLGISVMVIALVMTALLLTLQVAFCKYAHIKAVKATSPHMMHLIFSGCYLLIVALLIFTIQETFPGSLYRHPVAYGVMCSTTYWAFALGFTLVLGTIASTTWRIYRIFGHFKQGHVRFVADELLLLFVIFLISIDVVMLTAWNLTDPWHISVKVVSKEISVRIERLFCTSDNFGQWITIQFLYKGILAALLVFLSILVRRIKKKSFKSTKRIIALIYALLVDVFIGFTLYVLFLSITPILSYLCFSICLIAAVVIIFSLFLSPVIVSRFIPKTVMSSTREHPRPVSTVTSSNGYCGNGMWTRNHHLYTGYANRNYGITSHH
jgi:gamma-aminobutyric acid type B receptor